MNYKIHINDRNYSSWDILTEISMLQTELQDPSFNPLEYKLLTGDIINNKYEIIHSTIRNDNNIPGIILLLGKTYGRAKNGIGKFYYKCIPNDIRLPCFLVPYEQKILGFNKTVTNKYVLFKFLEWSSKHPIGSITNTIGDITIISNFYEYQLYCKNLFISIKEFTKTINNAYKQLDGGSFITEILAANPNIENRLDEYIISIDPKQSTDLDDAISIKDDIISIYIANVPILMEYFNLWPSFSERISTIYLPDRKCPMLPTLLSENLCSLLEGEQRFAFCVDIKFKDGEVVDIQFKNTLITVKKNYRYDDVELQEDKSYKDILTAIQSLNIKYNYVKEIKDSHDVVAYLMILMNYESANLLTKFKTGIFRTLSLKDTNINSTELTDEVYNFIKIWQASSGQYSNFEDKTGHAFIGVDNYVHITSPIRRLVDLLNMMNIQKHLGLITLGESATEFHNNWISRLEYINTTMRAIRRVQTDCHMLNLCVTDPAVLNTIYDGYMFDKVKWHNQFLQYTVYIPKLKMITRINIKEDIEDYSKHQFKLYLIEDGTTLKKKIRAVIQ